MNLLKKILNYKIIIIICKLIINSLLLPINFFFNKKKILIIGRIGGGIGDSLLITSILPKIKNKKIYILTNYPILFENNPYVYKNLDLKKYNKLFKFILLIFFWFSKQKNILSMHFFYKNNIFLQNFTKKYPTKYHLRDLYLLGTDYFKLSYKKKLNNQIYFSKKEEKKFKIIFKKILNKKINLIQSQSNREYIKIKDWGFENMQKVVNLTYKNIYWIQIGSKIDKKLKNTNLDLRDKISLRELAFIIKNTNLILCNEGLYTHLSSCFNVKCITIFTGYQHYSISNYSNIIPIEPSKKLSCLYCWEHKGCPLYKFPKCIKLTKISQVIKKI